LPTTKQGNPFIKTQEALVTRSRLGPDDDDHIGQMFFKENRELDRKSVV
jgi:hypothetical protein